MSLDIGHVVSAKALLDRIAVGEVRRAAGEPLCRICLHGLVVLHTLGLHVRWDRHGRLQALQLYVVLEPSQAALELDWNVEFVMFGLYLARRLVLGGFVFYQHLPCSLEITDENTRASALPGSVRSILYGSCTFDPVHHV